MAMTSKADAYRSPRLAGSVGVEGSTAKSPMGPLASLEAATSVLRAAQSRLQELADALCGSEPEADSSAGIRVCDGFFDQVDREAEFIRAISADMQNNLGRIERKL